MLRISPEPNRNRTLVALVGLGRVGKDSIASYLERRHSFASEAFARPLHEALFTLYGVRADELEAADKEIILPRLGRSVRELLQRLGDHVLEQLGPTALIERLIENCMDRGVWARDLVISDCRTELELDWARKQNASIWWVMRPGAMAVRNHRTESIAALRIKCYRPGDITVTNDGTLEQLNEQVDAALAMIGAPHLSASPL